MKPSAVLWIIWITIHSCQVSCEESIGLCPRNCTCTQFTLGQNITCCQKGKISSISSLHLRPNAYSLNLSQCRIENIPGGAFANATNLNTLIMRDGLFTQLKKNSFVGLINLQQLDLSNGSLHTVEKGTLGILKSLKQVSLIGNKALPLAMLPVILHSVSQIKTLREFVMGGINGVQYSTQYSIDRDYLRGLNGSNLRLCILADSHIREINPENSPYVANIPCLSMRKNLIDFVGRAEALKWLQAFMSSNVLVFDMMQMPPAEAVNYTSIAETCEEAISDSKNLRCPRLSTSDIRRFARHNPEFISFPWPHKLQRLNVGNVKLQVTINSHICYDNNITHVNAEGNVLMRFEGPIVGLTCLRFFTLARTKLVFMNIKSFLRYFPSLEYLNMSTTELGSQLDSKNLVFDNAPNLKTLDLSHNELHQPDAIDYSSLYPNLQLLYLHNNKFRSIPFIKLSKLKLLDLQQNQLTTVSKGDRSILQTLFQKNPGVKLRLAGNPFDCQCSREAYGFIEWLQRNKGHISDLDAVFCTVASPKGTVMKQISDISVMQFRSSCNRDIIIGTVVPLVCIIVVTVAAIMMYRKQWLLKLNWHRLQIRIRHKLKGTRTEESDEDVQLCEGDERFDKVYVIFCAKRDTDDYRFALNALAEILSEVNMDPIYHLTTLKHFLGNRPESLDIVEAMGKCNHCIIVLSPRLIHEYSNSEDTFEAEMDRKLVKRAKFAIHTAQEMCNVTTIFYKQPTPTEWMDDSFQKYVNLLRHPNHFLEWYDDHVSQQLAKEKLVNVLTGSESVRNPTSCCCH